MSILFINSYYHVMLHVWSVEYRVPGCLGP